MIKNLVDESDCDDDEDSVCVRSIFTEGGDDAADFLLAVASSLSEEAAEEALEGIDLLQVEAGSQSQGAIYCTSEMLREHGTCKRSTMQLADKRLPWDTQKINPSVLVRDLHPGRPLEDYVTNKYPPRDFFPLRGKQSNSFFSAKTLAMSSSNPFEWKQQSLNNHLAGTKQIEIDAMGAQRDSVNSFALYGNNRHIATLDQAGRFQPSPSISFRTFNPIRDMSKIYGYGGSMRAKEMIVFTPQVAIRDSRGRYVGSQPDTSRTRVIGATYPSGDTRVSSSYSFRGFR